MTTYPADKGNIINKYKLIIKQLRWDRKTLFKDTHYPDGHYKKAVYLLEKLLL